MISKQDRVHVRTPTQLEQKYKFDDISKNRNDSSKQNLLIQQINQDLANFKAQINARLEELGDDDKMWFYSGEPTLENYPAADWNTDELKAKHMGDMYCDVDNGNMYIFKCVDETYLWDSCFGDGACDVDHDALYQEGYTSGYESGYTDGKKSVPNPFEYATNVSQLYYGARFPKDTEMALVIPAATILNFLFYNALGLKKATLKGINDYRKMDAQQTFRDCTNLEIIDLLDFNIKLANAYQFCYNNSALKEIKGTLDFTECTNVNNMFTRCSVLEEVRFKVNTLALSISFQQSSNLSANSIQSIIDGLATVEVTQTLTLHTTIKAKITETQLTQITNKNWTLA